MTAYTVRAALRSKAAALMLGMAALAAGGVVTTMPAAAAVRAVVDKPLMEAKSLAAAGNYAAAMAKVRQAEGAAGITGDERAIISQMKSYIAVKSGGAGDVNSPLGAKAKFANDYRAGKWSQAIADGEMLRKYGALDSQSMAAIAGAYYRSGNYAGCVRYIRANFGNGGGEDILKLQMTCAYNAQDDEAQTAALEQLVARTGKAEYWAQLLKAAERTRGLNDHETLDIYRIKYLTGSMTTADDYILLSQLAIQLGFPGEAMAIEQKGMDAKILSGDRANRLMNMTKGQAGTEAATLGAKYAAAKNAPTGDALIKVGETLWGAGKYKDAIDAIQLGIKKDKTNLNSAYTRLGMAYLGAGQKADAIKAFGKVKGDPKAEMVAHLWVLYAKK